MSTPYTVVFAHSPSDVVMIEPLGLPAKVISVRTNGMQQEYFCTWWCDGKMCDGWIDGDFIK